jgi:DNA-binding response OmpR family regulator
VTVTRPVVLVVDDEETVADVYAKQLEDEYDTRTAYGGREALAKLGDDVDAVLLDRRMPDVHGDEVLARIREQGYDCRVIMTTAVDPDLNILEMEFDDYLCKPIEQETLLTTLDKHLDSRPGTDERLAEFFRILSKLSVLTEEKTRAELQAHDEYVDLRTRAAELSEQLRDEVEDFEELADTYRDIDRD